MEVLCALFHVAMDIISFRTYFVQGKLKAYDPYIFMYVENIA